MVLHSMGLQIPAPFKELLGLNLNIYIILFSCASLGGNALQELILELPECILMEVLTL